MACCLVPLFHSKQLRGLINFTFEERIQMTVVRRMVNVGGVGLLYSWNPRGSTVHGDKIINSLSVERTTTVKKVTIAEVCYQDSSTCYDMEVSHSSFSTQILPPMTLSWVITALYLLLSRLGRTGSHDSSSSSSGSFQENQHPQRQHSQLLLVYLAGRCSLALAIHSNSVRN